jgi:hypothetical protein
MKRIDLSGMDTDELVQRFVTIALEQDYANLGNETSRYNQLYDRMKEVEDELKRRSGDQRRALLSLYDHENPEVRLKSAKATLALAPEAARAVLQALANSNQFPQAGAAGMALDLLNEGAYRPT